MKQFYVYIYRDPSRGNEAIYCGKGCKSKCYNRAYDHLKRTDHHPFVFRLAKMKSNGVEPTIEIINAINEDHAFFLEDCLVDLIGRKDLGTGTLLNLCAGGKGGITNPSSATRQKMSDKLYGNQRRKGKLHTSATIGKMSKANSGKNNGFYGMKHNQQLKEHLSQVALSRPKLTCVHCGKVCSVAMAKRWHFDNCKLR